MRFDQVFPEPLLQFGRGNESPDIRHGIAEFGPVDLDTPLHKSSVKMGLVGTHKTIEAFNKWMQRCALGITSEDTQNQNFSPSFPGMNPQTGLGCDFGTSRMWTHILTEEELKKAMNGVGVVQALATLFHDGIHTCFAASAIRPDVVLCLPPETVRIVVKPRLGEESQVDEEDRAADSIDFHDYLKALCLQRQYAFQLIWPRTYLEGDKGVQDEATRAWNLFTGIFYKAGGVPWKLARPPGAPNTCYVGISFARQEDGGYMHLSLTQVFNDKGEGTILRGRLAKKSQQDFEVHLDEGAAQELLTDAIRNFQKANSQRIPERVVIHKSSGFDAGELAGFNKAASSLGVRFKDFVAINKSYIRWFRKGSYPPLRGTHIILDETTSILYTRGSVPFYRKYPGGYVPTTLQLRYFQTERSATELASEVLALTKLNWNKTQFDSHFPITLEGSRRISQIYRWCPNVPAEAVSYALFM